MSGGLEGDHTTLTNINIRQQYQASRVCNSFGGGKPLNTWKVFVLCSLAFANFIIRVSPLNANPKASVLITALDIFIYNLPWARDRCSHFFPLLKWNTSSLSSESVVSYHCMQMTTWCLSLNWRNPSTFTCIHYIPEVLYNMLDWATQYQCFQ